MAIIIKISEIVEKHRILKKSNPTPDEIKRLNDIESLLSDIRKDIIELEQKGVKIINDSSEEQLVKEKEIKREKKQKLTPSERKNKILLIIEDLKKSKIDNKEIIKRISTEFGVSNTYVYKMLKERK